MGEINIPEPIIVPTTRPIPFSKLTSFFNAKRSVLLHSGRLTLSLWRPPVDKKGSASSAAADIFNTFEAVYT